MPTASALWISLALAFFMPFWLMAQDASVLPLVQPGHDVARPIKIGPPAPSVPDTPEVPQPLRSAAGIDAVPPTEAALRVRLAADPALSAPLRVIAQAWADSRPGQGEVEITVAPTVEIFRQLKESPGKWDLLMVAKGEALTEAEEAGLVLQAGRRQIGSMSLAILGAAPLIASESMSWREQLEREWTRIGYADPAKDASGAAAQAFLANLGLVTEDGPSGKAVRISNETELIARARRGELDALVGLSCHLASEEVRGYVLHDPDSALPEPAPRVSFVVVNTPGDDRLEAKLDFQTLLASDAVQLVLRQHNFEVP